MSQAPVIQVVTVGKSTGSTTLASVLACGAVAYELRPVLIEFDPSGGDLVGRIPGAAEHRRLGSFTDEVQAKSMYTDGGVDLGSYVNPAFPAGPGIVVCDPSGRGVVVDLGVDEFGSWVHDAGYDSAIFDCGRWRPGVVRDDCDLLYGFASVETPADLERAVVGCHRLRTELRGSGRLVLIFDVEPWAENKLLDEFPPDGDWDRVRMERKRPVRKAWEFFRDGKWEAGMDSKGFDWLRRLAVPVYQVDVGRDRADREPDATDPEIDDAVAEVDAPAVKGAGWAVPDDWMTETT